MTTTILENARIEALTRQFSRSPQQLNELQGADAEIIRLDPQGTACIAVTTDSIVEEITSGLYKNPFLIGWMTVMANMSDLAAVGAIPLGILISEVLPADIPPEWLSDLQRGIQKACKACGSFVLGGDTNSGSQLLLSGTAIGTTSRDRLLSRVGAQPGDQLYCTGNLGIGNAFAMQRLQHRLIAPDDIVQYQPSARLREGQSIAGIASSCMDTSDGVLATLDQLMRINHIGFEMKTEIESCLHPQAKLAAACAGIPPWYLLAGQHGEFELLFTVSRENELELLEIANGSDWKPLRLGRVIREEEIQIPLYGQQVMLDTARIRNLALECGSDIRRYIQELSLIDNMCKEGALNNVN